MLSHSKGQARADGACPGASDAGVGYESDVEGKGKWGSRLRSEPSVHLRSISDVSEYDTKPPLPVARALGLDSGVGSCSESEASDCERKMKELALARQQRPQIHRPQPSLGLDFQPSWPRIKRFYGIPKPASSLARQLPTAPPQAPDSPASPPPTKPRSESSP